MSTATDLTTVNVKDTDCAVVGVAGVAGIAGFADLAGPCPNVYVRDLVTGTTTLVSVAATGDAGGSSASFGPVFSPDGTQVAFTSYATDLTDPPLAKTCDGPAACGDVFVHDLVAHKTRLVSHDAAGTGGGDGPSTAPAFSPDGSQIAFRSSAANLVAGVADTNKADDVFVHDLGTGAVTGVTVTPAGNTAGDGAAGPFTPRWSPDGTRLLFTTAAGDLGPTDTNGVADVYLRDLVLGSTSIVSVSFDGVRGNGDSFVSAADGTNSFSPDGTLLLIHSAATNLGPVDTNDLEDLYSVEPATRVVMMVTNKDNGDGAEGANAPTGPGTFGTYEPAGPRIAFVHPGTDLLPVQDTNEASDIFLTVTRPG